jgi:hypothetical protein
MRIPREVWWIVGLTAAAVVLVVLLGGTRDADDGDALLPKRTTYSSSPAGLRGLYLALGRLGYEVGRLRRPLTSANLPERATLLVVEPIPPPLLSQTEMEDLRRWVAAGNTLVLCGGPTMPTTAPAEIDVDEMDFASIFGEPEWSEARPAQPVYLTSGVGRLAVRSAFRIALGDQEHPAHTEEDEDECLACDGGGASELMGDLAMAAPVASDEHGVLAAYAPVGQGQVVLFASPWSLSNEGIDEADNFTFILNAVGAPGSAPVYFDEYHHGYAENIAWGLLPLPVKLGLAQIVLGLLLVAYARSRRLGPVVPLERGGRQRSEFLGTMTTVLRRGHATRLAVRTAYETTGERLRVQMGVAGGADDQALAGAVARANPEAAARLEETLAELRAALTGPAPTEARAMELLRRLDEAAAAARRI